MPFRRPPLQLPKPDAPLPGTTASSWFGTPTTRVPDPTVPAHPTGAGPSVLNRPVAGSGHPGGPVVAQIVLDEPSHASTTAGLLVDPIAYRRRRLRTAGLVILGLVLLLAGVRVSVGYVAANAPAGGLRKLSAAKPTTRTVTVPLGTLTSARLDLLAAASRVRLSIGETGDDLYRITAPADADVTPNSVERGDTVRVAVTPPGGEVDAEVEVVLAARVRWQIRVFGQVKEQVVDLRAGRITRVAMGGGTGRTELDLPEAAGTVPVTITGASGQLTLRSPVGCPVRVRLGGGATAVLAGTRALRDLPAGATLTPRAWRTPNRYQVTTGALVRSLTVQNVG